MSFCSEKLDVKDANLPIAVSTLSLYLASLFSKGYAASTMITYNSAIGYFHKLNGMQDPASSELINKLLQGAKKSRIQVDSRLPITQSILHRLILLVAFLIIESCIKLCF